MRRIKADHADRRAGIAIFWVASVALDGMLLFDEKFTAARATSAREVAR